MTSSKLEARQEKTKEKLEEKARKKKEEKEAAAEGAPKETKKKETKKKAEIKKPKVSEIKGKGSYLPISPKISVEVCRAIKGQPVENAKKILKDAIELKRPIRYYRYKKDTPHKPGKGFGAGRYPVKVSKYILEVLENAIANATYLNMDPERLYVKIARSERVISKEKKGRYSNIEIIVAEREKEKKPTKKKVKK